METYVMKNLQKENQYAFLIVFTKYNCIEWMKNDYNQDCTYIKSFRVKGENFDEVGENLYEFYDFIEKKHNANVIVVSTSPYPVKWFELDADIIENIQSEFDDFYEQKTKKAEQKQNQKVIQQSLF